MAKASEYKELGAMLRRAPRTLPTVWTPECLEPDEIIALIETKEDTPVTRQQMAHVVACGHCLAEMRAMEEAFQIAADARRESPSSDEVVEGGSWRTWMDTLRSWLVSPPAIAAGVCILVVTIGGFGIDWQMQIAELRREKALQASKSADLATRLKQVEADASRDSAEIAALKDRLRIQATHPPLVARDDEALIEQALKSGLRLPKLPRVNSLVMRGGSNPSSTKAILLSPASTLTLDATPTFKWKSVPGSTGYEVTVIDSKSKIVEHSNVVTNTSWKPQKALPRGAEYAWQVKALSGGQELLSDPAGFRVANATEATKYSRVEQASRLSLGIQYAQAGLLEEAEQIFASVPTSDPNYSRAVKLLSDLQNKKRLAIESK